MNPESRAWNEKLIGVEGGIARLDTPALVLDLDAFEYNLRAMVAIARAHGVALRPHAKTHKSVAVAKAQLEAGAIVGFCCAKLGEAEALARGGIDRILLTSPVFFASKLERLVALHARLRELSVVVDDPVQVEALAAAFSAAGRRLRVLVDVDVGSHRFGVPTVADALALARRIAAEPALELAGIQGYAGTVQHIPDYRERAAAAAPAAARLAEIRDALRAEHLPCPIVTGAGTGTHEIDAKSGVFTDLQVGSYAFMDVEYLDCALTDDGTARFRPALEVWTRVVSRHHPGFVTTDAGIKCFATDGPPPRVAAGAPEGARYRMFGDQFGRLELPPGAPNPPLGAIVRCIVPHCDPTINLWDHLLCRRGETLEAIWAIEGRGAVA
ncbi:MAG: DSD1 family PLP-dependent enzyme [Geminicoccaceae bacterium]|nr:DSD1 family PLP-dependent enzyme [Geminicoccaceae bacterium]